jgi:hypothetical protein
MENVTVKIEGEGLSVTKTTTFHKAGQIISFLGLDDASAPNREAPGTETLTLLLPAKRVQPKDVIVTSGAKTYPQKVVAIAVYLRDQLGQQQFTSQEIKTALKKMGDEPGNFGRDLRSAQDLQYIICVDEAADVYELTDKGAEEVASSFAGGSAKKSATAKRPPVSKGVSDEVRAFDFGGGLEGFPDYHKLQTKGDKILWLLAYADAKSVKSLTPTEVDFLSTELRDRVEGKGFTALNQRNMRNNFVLKKSDGFQIQHKGLEHLKSLNLEA